MGDTQAQVPLESRASQATSVSELPKQNRNFLLRLGSDMLLNFTCLLLALLASGDQ